jgi:hypothetical protein
MSPSKSRQQFIPSRPRAEVFTAVAVGAAIVLGTALLVWLIRPGTPGVPGGGGLLNRQPRVTILVLLIAALVGGVVAFVRSRRRPTRLGARGSIAVGSAAVVVLGVVGGIFWPGGVVRHWPTRPKITTPVTNPPTASTTAPQTPSSPTTKPKTATSVTTVPPSATTVTTTPSA